jgi:uncharacterized protein (TIGR02145 family)
MRIAFIFTFLILLSCKKQQDSSTNDIKNVISEVDTLLPYLPKIKTVQVNTIGCFDAMSGGIIISSGKDNILTKGVCWSKDSTFNSTLITKTIDGKGFGDFTSKITGLEYGTTYYLKSYASNSFGTAYGNLEKFQTSLPLFKNGNGVKDIDGNSYKTIILGDQEWMSENLAVSKLNDGTEIPYVYDIPSWYLTKSFALCLYENELTNKAKFGCLYNGYVVETNKVCPTGWHVPIRKDWEKLLSILGSDNVAGGKLKYTGLDQWVAPNSFATNISGFNGKGAGLRTKEGYFVNKYKDGFFWTNESIEIPYHKLFYRQLNYAVGYFYETNEYPGLGASIRCVKD